MNLFIRLRRDPLACFCLVLISAVLFVGIFAPWFAPFDPNATAPHLRNLAPNAQHWLGTDQLGRDVFSRLIFGVRTTFFYALLSMTATLALGAIIGVSAAILGGRIERFLMRLCDLMLSFPSEVLILALIGLLGVSATHILLAIIVSKWAWYARMLNGLTHQICSRLYVQFARACGATKLHIVRRHLLPNIASDCVILASADINAVILLISTLSFLGLGVQAPTAEWGAMLSEAKNQMLFYPEQMLPAGITIMLVMICCNVLGDFLRDWLDPNDSLRGTV